MIPAHHPDYDVFLEEQKKGHKQKDQAVFIDQNMPFHHDFLQSKTPSVNEEPYYAGLQKFLLKVEKRLSLEVVIAAHPRTEISKIQKYFGSRLIEKGATARLILESRLVFTHSSISSYLAIMANKPLVILTDKQLWNVGINGNSCKNSRALPMHP